MSNPFKRFASTLIAVMMVITMVPSQAFAASEGESENEISVSADSFDSDSLEESASEQESQAVPNSSVSEMPVEEDITAAEGLSTSDEANENTPNEEPGQETSLSDSGILSSGECSESVSWILYATGELVISGSGPIPDYGHYYGDAGYNTNAPWGYSLATNIQKIIIESGITAIGYDSFCGCNSLKCVVLPDSVSVIGANAFAYCRNLNNIFYGGSSYTDIAIRSSNTSLTTAYWHCNYHGEDIVELVATPSVNGSLSLPALAYKGETISATVEADPGYIFSELAVNNGIASGTNITISSVGDFSIASVEASFVPLEPDKSISHTGTCGNDVNWVLYDSGELWIYGTGAISNYASSSYSVPWGSYRSQIKNITIESGVTHIGNYAFYSCTGLTNVIIPDSVTSIGDYAFDYCYNLQDVFYPADSFDSLGISAYYNSYLVNSNWHYHYNGKNIIELQTASCTGGSITLPFSVGFQGETVAISAVPSAGYVFSSLTADHGTADDLTVTISEVGDFSTVTIGAVFDYLRPEKTLVNSGVCGNQANWVVYEDGELYIYGSGTMYDYSAGNTPWYSYRAYITSVVIDNGITAIGDYAFTGLASLTNVSLPSSLNSIGECSFADCSRLTHISIPGNVTAMGSNVFSGCSGLASSGPIDSGCSIEYGWSTSIPANAFSGCSSIASIDLPSTLTSIGASAFSGCTTLEAIRIPSSVTAIGGSAFENCSALGSVEVPTGVSAIESSTFAGCSAMTNIRVPNSVTSIGDRAFYDCSKLADIVLPEDLTLLGGYAFYNCGSLTELDVPGGVASIGEYTFYECTNLSSISISDAMASIGEYAFYGCSALEHIALPSGLISIADYLFYGCSSLSEITVPTGVKTIGHSAFCECAAITEIILPSGVTTISSSAFANCENLKHVFIPGSITTFYYTGSSYRPSGGVFDGCPKLKTAGPVGGGFDIEYEWTASIPSYAFLNCTSLENVVLGPVMASVGSYAFYGCTVLKSIVIPKSVTSVASYAFQNCTSLGAVLYIGSEIYRGSMTIDSNNTYLENATWSYISSMDEIRSITVGAVEGGTISVSDTIATDGAVITVYATPNKGYRLSKILVDGASIDGTSFTVTGNHTITAVFAFYKDVTADGVCGSNLRWDLYTDGELRIFGSGSMSDYSSQSAPWYGCREQIKTIIIENGVTNIGDYAFRSLDALTNVLIPQSVKTVGYCALNNCDSLISVVIPEGVTVIEENAFSSCDNLTVVVLPSTIFSIEREAFEYCNEISDIFYPGTSLNGISIGSYNSYITDKFWHYGYDGSEIVSLVSGHSLVTLPCEYAFKGETLSQAVTVGAKPGYTFSGLAVDYGSADGLTVMVSSTGDFDTVTVGAEFTLVGEKEIVASGFCGSNPVESVMWILYSDGELYIYGDGTMWYDRWPSYDDAPWYSYRSQISSLTIVSGVTSIPGHAFNGCAGLTGVVISDGVDSIGQCAFYGCSGLTNISIPSSVTSIGNSAFEGCSKLNSVEFLGNAPSTIGSEAFPSTSAGQFVIYYHSGTTGWTTPTWNGYYTVCVDETLSEYSALDSNNRNSQNILFTLNDESNTAIVGDNSAIDNNCGYNGSNNGAVVIPATVTKGGRTYRVIGISQRAFSGNRLLSTLEIGTNITSVDPTAFGDCLLFAEFSVNPGNTHYKADGGILYDTSKYNLYVYPYGKIGDAFSVPASVTTIGAYAFSGNPYLKEIVVPDTVASIGWGAFRGCVSLEKITLPYIGGSIDSEQTFSYVFGSNYHDSYLYLPQGLKTVVITDGTLHGQSFYNCRNLESITLPANDTEIPYQCFYGCNALKTLRFRDQMESPEAGHLIIPDRITAIRESAFNYCTGIAIVNIPAATAIGRQEYYWDNDGNRQYYWFYSPAFDGCTSLTEYRVADSNPHLCSDQWGVLYNKDRTTLCDYPSARKWPYYNVADQTTRISRCAFNSCTNLVNLYIPNAVTTIEDRAITSCPGMTVCAYLNSTAYTYAGNNNIPSWAMDNYRLQGIEIYALPENTVAAMGTEDFSGLYVTVNVGKVLQLDSYSLRYNAKQSGIQTATVSYMGQTAAFDILLYNENTEHLVDFGEIDLPDGTSAYAAVYDTSGKMVQFESVAVMNRRVQIVIQNSTLTALRDAKLFIFNNVSYIPRTEPITISKRDIEAANA